MGGCWRVNPPVPNGGREIARGVLVRARLLIGDASEGGVAIDGGMAKAVAMAMKSGAMAIFASLLQAVNDGRRRAWSGVRRINSRRERRSKGKMFLVDRGG